MDTAKFVNTATGRGSLGGAEKYGDLLNTIFYSPRFQASRLDLMTKFLRPDTYTKLNPKIRREYLRALLSMGGVAATTNGIGYALGGKLTADPKSSDFGKVTYGNIRQDPGAGSRAAGGVGLAHRTASVGRALCRNVGASGGGTGGCWRGGGVASPSSMREGELQDVLA